MWSKVSIHAPAWGATTRRTGGHTALARPVSIHAPAWGATQGLFTGDMVDAQMLFQSTPPHGERRNGSGKSAIRCSAKGSFNPRPRMGSDPSRLTRRPDSPYGQFQSTPPHGERRQRRIEEVKAEIVSIHAPAWGATSFATRTSENVDVPRFNPRPRMGSDVSLLR